MAPQTIRPDMLYNVVAMLVHDELQETSVYTGITHSGEVLAEAVVPVAVNSLATIPLKVMCMVIHVWLVETKFKELNKTLLNIKLVNNIKSWEGQTVYEIFTIIYKNGVASDIQ